MASRINWRQHIGGQRAFAGCLLPAAQAEPGDVFGQGPGAWGLAAGSAFAGRLRPGAGAGWTTASGHRLELPTSAEPRWVAELLRCLG